MTSGARPSDGSSSKSSAGATHQRPGDGQHLLLAAARGCRPAASAVPAAAGTSEPAVDVGADLGSVLADVGAGLQVLLDGQLGERAPTLRHVGDAEPHHLLGALADELLAARSRRCPWCRPSGTSPASSWSCRRRWRRGARPPRPRRREVDAAQHLDRAVAGARGPRPRAGPSRCRRSRGRPRSPWDRSAPRPVSPRRSCGRSRAPRPCRRCPSPSHVVLDEQHGEAEAVAETADRARQLVDLGVGEPGRRLVEQEQRGSAAMARASSMRLSVPKGSPTAGRSARSGRPRSPRMRRPSRSSRSLLAPHADPERRRTKLDVTVGVRPDHHVLEHGQAREQGEVLERAGDAEAGDAVGRRPRAGPCRRSAAAPLVGW